jgi:hypothetical protein
MGIGLLGCGFDIIGQGGGWWIYHWDYGFDTALVKVEGGGNWDMGYG